MFSSLACNNYRPQSEEMLEGLFQASESGDLNVRVFVGEKPSHWSAWLQHLFLRMISMFWFRSAHLGTNVVNLLFGGACYS